MALRREPLVLDPDPRSARAARGWVRDILTSLGRDDLVESAQLGVSELVTNAVLHAVPPITVSVRGTREHPRVEVHDSSEEPPETTVDITDGVSLMATFGRGISIVASYSATWGADLSGTGKTVWFEPVREPRPDPDVRGELYDFAQRVAARLPANDDAVERLEVQLLNLPVQLFAASRVHYEELTRELRLLALAHGEDYPVATEVTELALQSEQERRLARGVEALDRAIHAGVDHVDLTYQVPTSTPATMARMGELLEKAEAFCQQERMLSTAAPPLQLELQRWYLCEFVRQGAGEPPRPWTGGPEGDPQP